MPDQGIQMKKLHFVLLALASASFPAMAGDSGLFYLAGGATKGGAAYGIAAGTDVDVLEISSLNLGTVNTNASVRFRGLSLIQNATPIKDFNLLFRLGVGKTTTDFVNGAQASRTGISKGIIFGLGGQYKFNSHLALRGEVDRLTYAASADGMSSSITYPVTASLLFIF
jgi:hypothetical protein